MTKLDGRVRGLIAVGASVTANCLPCLEYHVGEASRNGAEPDELAEALEVGRMVRKGAASKFDRRAADLVGPGAGAAAAGCGCGEAATAQPPSI